MSYTCIICGNPAGSAEHVFPSALGGAAENKRSTATTTIMRFPAIPPAEAEANYYRQLPSQAATVVT
jgi:hypothetical protein